MVRVDPERGSGNTVASVPTSGYAGDLTAEAAWKRLETNPEALLIDVRTRPEWSFIGVPDLSSLARRPLLISWQIFPSMVINPHFAEELRQAGARPDQELLFLCRSGGRSRAAAIAMTAEGFPTCFNIEGGFEGPPDARHHRGLVAGWKAAGLPWSQE